MKKLLALLFFATPVYAQLNVPITVQPAEWTGQAQTVGGTRTNAPVTFGLGLPDSAGIDCPSTGASLPVQNQAAPTKLILKYSGAQVSSQFRCMAAWPDTGHAKWVLVDAQIGSLAESTGYDANLSVAQVSGGGGNVTCSSGCSAATPMAVDSNPGSPSVGTITVTTGAATFVIQKTGYDLFHSVVVGSTTLVSAANHGANDGLILVGPSHTVITGGGIASVSCGAGPIPTNYSGASCSTPYLSNNTSTACIIEENGGLRSAIMCQGDLVNSSGDVYMHWRTRMHFWKNHSDCKVTVGLRNADLTTAGAPVGQNFASAYKEFTQFEARLTDNLGAPSARNFGIANGLSIPGLSVTSGTGFSSSSDVYLWQGFSLYGLQPDWTNASNCTLENDGCVVSPIPRSGATASTREYSLDGGQLVQAGSGSAQWIGEVTGSTGIPAGWADLDDGGSGIEVGVYQLAMHWPKSLEFQPTPSGASTGNEIRIGIKPNQQEWLTSGSPYQINPSYSSASPNSAAQVSYAMPWPQYDITDLYFNFHTGVLSGSGYAAAQNDFLYSQHYLLARPQSGTYYNSVVDSTYTIPALFYYIPDPVAQDTYWNGVSSSICGSSFGQCLGDVGTSGFPYYASGTAPYGGYNGMKVFPFFIWTNAGGSNGTQEEQRDDFLRQFEQRGGASNVGSVPGRYIWAANWYRMIVEKSLPRSDTATTSGSGAGWRSLMQGLGCTTTNTAACDALNFEPFGDPKLVNLTSGTTAWNGGMRNWGDDANVMSHSHYWGIFDYYFLSGDEWVKEQLLQGFKDRYQNPFVPFNNLDANVGSGGNSAPGHGHIGELRAVGVWLSGAAHFASFLRDINDPDQDSATTVLTSPGTGTATATAMQGIEQVLAAQVFLPYVNGGYPAGWSETSLGSVNCVQATGPTNNCTQGQSPVRGGARSGVGNESCAGSTAPCNGTSFRALDSFQLGSWTNGLYDTYLAMHQIQGPNWHLNIGAGAGGSGGIAPVDGGTSTASLALNPSDVTISEKGLLDAMYGAHMQMMEQNCIDGGSYSNSGCVYDQAFDYLNGAPPACTSTGNCYRNCSTGGCGGATQWFAMAGSAPSTNNIYDLTSGGCTAAGTPCQWQRILEAQATHDGILSQEWDSHMLNFAENYILNGGSTSANGYAVSASVPVLKQVPTTVTSCTGAGCSFTSTYCIGPASGTGTCTITWSAPAGLSTVNGVSYRLKYDLCNSGSLTIEGSDCPAGGKTIVPSLFFRSDCLTSTPCSPVTNVNALNAANSVNNGSWINDPAHNQNFFATVDVPDCGNGTSTSGCNSTVPSGTSYTFTSQAGYTYNFFLAAYSASCGQCYYISSSIGSDSNAGTKLAPWAHSPGMNGASGNAGAHTPVAGDQFIFYGGDTWGVSNFQMSVSHSGSSGNNIVYGGEDTGWFNTTSCNAWGAVNTYASPVDDGTATLQSTTNVMVGSATTHGFTPQLVGKTVNINGTNYTVVSVQSATNMTVTPAPPNQTGVSMTSSNVYCRPIFDFQNTMVGSSCSGSSCAGVELSGTNYVTLDNIDWRRFVNANNVSGQPGYPAFHGNMLGQNDGLNTLTNNFFHDWSVAGAISANSTTLGIGSAYIAEYNTISDRYTQNSGGNFSGLGIFSANADSIIAYNTCIWAVDCFDTQAANVAMHDNKLYDLIDDTADSNDHGNSIHAECYGYYYNNLIFNMRNGTTGLVGGSGVSGISGQINGGSCPTGTHTFYTWNNVQFNLGNQSCFLDSPSGSSNVITYYHYNDTCVVPGSGGVSASAVRAGANGQATAAENIINMHVISALSTNALTTSSSSGALVPFLGQQSGDLNPTGGTTVTTSYQMTVTGTGSAAAEGYTIANNFTPTASGNSTVGVGTNESSNCTGAFASQCFDILGVARPSNWDVGAYQFTVLGGAVTLAPTSYLFSTTVVGSGPSSDSPFSFTLTNTTSVTLTGITISVSPSTDFTVTSTTCGGTLAASSTCAIAVTFTPSATGLRSATLMVADSNPSSPQTSSLSGTGIPPVTNPVPAGPVTFGIAVTDSSIPSTVKNENEIRSENLHAHNFAHVALLGVLHEERSGYSARATSGQ